MMKVCHSEAVGIDIGPQYLEIVHLVRRRRNVRVVHVNRVRMPDSDQDRLQMIRSYVQQNKLGKVPCVVGLSGETHMLRVLDPGMKKGRLHGGANPDQARYLAGIDDESAVSEYSLLRRYGRHRRGLLAFIRRDTVESVMDLSMSAGLLRVVGLTPVSLGAFNSSVKLHAPSKDFFLVVEMNPHGSEVMVGCVEALLAHRRFHADLRAGHQETGEAQTWDDAEFEQWLTQLDACISYCREEIPDMVEKTYTIYLFSDYALSERERHRLEEITGMRCVSQHGVETRSGNQHSNQLYAAYGLALCGLGVGAVQLNLLPAEEKERLVLQEQLKYWLVTGLCAMSASAIFFTSMLGECRRLQAVVAEKQRLLQQREEKNRDLATLRERSALLSKQIEPLRIAVQNARTVVSALGLLGATKSEADWIVLFADNRSYLKEFTSRIGGSFAGGEANPLEQTSLQRGAVTSPTLQQIVVEGYTPSRDLAGVRSMIDALRVLPAVEKADLLADDKVRTNSERDARWAFTGGQLFALEVEMVP